MESRLRDYYRGLQQIIEGKGNSEFWFSRCASTLRKKKVSSGYEWSHQLVNGVISLLVGNGLVQKMVPQSEPVCSET